MQKGSLKTTPIFYKYLISYILVLLIPVGLLGYYGSLQLTEIVNHYVEKTNKEMLSQLSEGVDAKIIEMNKIAARISSNPDLTPYSITKDFYNTYQIKPLLDYKVSNDFIQELLFYVRGESYLYSSFSTYRLPIFINDIYQFQNWPEMQFLDDLNSITKPTLRTAEDVTFMSSANERLITYLLPIPTGSLHPYATVMFVIKENSLLNFLKYDGFPRSGNTIIYDEKNRIVTSYKGEQSLNDVTLNESVDPAGDMFSVVQLQQSKYFITRLKSSQTGWTYVTVLPVSDVMKPINTAVNKWLNTLFIILLIGSAVIYVVMRYNYNPIKKLLISYRELGQKFEKNRSAIFEHLLSSLIKGEVETLEQLNERGKEVGLEFYHAGCVAFIVEASNLNIELKKRIVESTTNQISPSMAVYSKESFESERIIFLASTGFSDRELSEWLEQWHAEIHRDYGIKLTCGVGQLQQQLHHIGRSFIEASTAVDYKLIKGTGRIIFFHEVATDHSSSLYASRMDMEYVSYLLREGRTEQIAQELAQFTDKIKQGGTTLFVTRMLCYDIIHTVMKTVDGIHKEFPEMSDKFPDVLTLMEFHTIEELVELISKACIDLCNAIQQQKGNPGDRLIDSMIGYLQHYCGNCEFSVQMMAAHFSLSTSYISRFFKEHTGQTITDYANAIRISNAKQLLKDSDCSIKEIVQLVGYFDTSSFIRKFKAAVGVTPGEYRRMSRQ